MENDNMADNTEEEDVRVWVDKVRRISESTKINPLLVGLWLIFDLLKDYVDSRMSGERQMDAEFKSRRKK
jgi:hypothetical protein